MAGHWVLRLFSVRALAVRSKTNWRWWASILKAEATRALSTPQPKQQTFNQSTGISFSLFLQLDVGALLTSPNFVFLLAAGKESLDQNDIGIAIADCSE
jgi:hypothetical protein